MLCRAMEKLNGQQPQPQILAGSGADLRLLCRLVEREPRSRE